MVLAGGSKDKIKPQHLTAVMVVHQQNSWTLTAVFPYNYKLAYPYFEGLF